MQQMMWLSRTGLSWLSCLAILGSGDESVATRAKGVDAV